MPSMPPSLSPRAPCAALTWLRAPRRPPHPQRQRRPWSRGSQNSRGPRAPLRPLRAWRSPWMEPTLKSHTRTWRLWPFSACDRPPAPGTGASRWCVTHILCACGWWAGHCPGPGAMWGQPPASVVGRIPEKNDLGAERLLRLTDSGVRPELMALWPEGLRSGRSIMAEGRGRGKQLISQQQGSRERGKEAGKKGGGRGHGRPSRRGSGDPRPPLGPWLATAVQRELMGECVALGVSVGSWGTFDIQAIRVWREARVGGLFS